MRWAPASFTSRTSISGLLLPKETRAPSLHCNTAVTLPDSALLQTISGASTLTTLLSKGARLKGTSCPGAYPVAQQQFLHEAVGDGMHMSNLLMSE